MLVRHQLMRNLQLASRHMPGNADIREVRTRGSLAGQPTYWLGTRDYHGACSAKVKFVQKRTMLHAVCRANGQWQPAIHFASRLLANREIQEIRHRGPERLSR